MDQISLRDYFAGKAMQGLISIEYSCEDYDLSNKAYKIADAMIEAGRIEGSVWSNPLTEDEKEKLRLDLERHSGKPDYGF